MSRSAPDNHNKLGSGDYHRLDVFDSGKEESIYNA